MLSWYPNSVLMERDWKQKQFYHSTVMVKKQNAFKNNPSSSAFSPLAVSLLLVSLSHKHTIF